MKNYIFYVGKERTNSDTNHRNSRRPSRILRENDGVENLWTINGQDGITADYVILLPDDPVS